jgi:membrane-associated protein
VSPVLASAAAHTLPLHAESDRLSASVIAPAHLLGTYGLIGLLVIIFAECGLLVGFFLPGDTLLFSAGLLMAVGQLNVSVYWAAALVPIAAVAGNFAGYWIGFVSGPRVFRRSQSRLFRPEYVTRSEAFFDRYGAPAIVLARFVPVVRTVSTVLAGVGRMSFVRYAVYSVVGAVLWSDGILLTGYWLGHITFVRTTVEPLIDPIIVAVVVISLLPVAVHWWRSRPTRSTVRS